MRDWEDRGLYPPRFDITFQGIQPHATPGLAEISLSEGLNDIVFSIPLNPKMSYYIITLEEPPRKFNPKMIASIILPFLPL